VNPDAVPLFVYHSVSDRPEADDWTLRPDVFRRHMTLIAESGRGSLGFSDYARQLAARRRAPGPQVLVTIDDGYADALDAAAICQELGLQLTVFVTWDYVGRPGMLSTYRLRELAAFPSVEIGAHAVTHRRLDELSLGDIRQEVRNSRDALERELSASVTSFAYPHGNYDARVARCVAEAGYTGAAAVRNALSHPGDDPFAVARWIVARRAAETEVAELLQGRGPLAPARERLITKGYRWFRRGRALVSAPQATEP
jgi:peptidoglycan/xylan/chitin deacetylase (PgdA/CDA1 family)